MDAELDTGLTVKLHMDFQLHAAGPPNPHLFNGLLYLQCNSYKHDILQVCKYTQCIYSVNTPTTADFKLQI